MDSGRVKPRKPYSDFAAWVDLLFEAAYEDHRIFIQGRMVDLKRGEVPHSLRTLAERWGWNLSAVKRFLDMLKTETQTKHRTEHGITLLVIANYDAYQSDASENETRKIEKPKHERNTNETNITKETRETKKQTTNPLKAIAFIPPAENVGENVGVNVGEKQSEIKPVGEREDTDAPIDLSGERKLILDAFPAFFDLSALAVRDELVQAMPKLMKTWDEYPALDWRNELEKANDWLLAGGKKKKKYDSFIRNWMKRVYEGMTPQKNHIEKLFGVDWNPGESDIEAWRAIARGCVNGNDVIGSTGDATDSGCDSWEGASGPVPVPGV
jgi:hypothetical protein